MCADKSCWKGRGQPAKPLGTYVVKRRGGKNKIKLMSMKDFALLPIEENKMGNNLLCLNMHVLDLSKRKDHVLLINTDYLVIEEILRGSMQGGKL